MTRRVDLPDDLRREMIDHCIAEAPNEGCGLLAMDGDRVTRVYPTANIEKSPISYTIAPGDHSAALLDAEANGWRLGGVFHSHPRGGAEMSAIDREKALEPEWAYVVIGLGGDDPQVGIHCVSGSP